VQLPGLVGQFEFRRRRADSQFFGGRDAGCAAPGSEEGEL
jgi:hypothetical protein